MSEERALGKRPRGEADASGDDRGDSGDDRDSVTAASKDEADGDAAMAAADAADEDFIEENEGRDGEDSDGVEDIMEDEELLRMESKGDWEENKKSLKAHIGNDHLRARRFEVARQFDADEFATEQVVCRFYLDSNGLLMCEENSCARPHCAKNTSTTSYHHCVLHIEKYHTPAKRRTTTGRINAAAGRQQKELHASFRAGSKSTEGQCVLTCNHLHRSGRVISC